MGVFFLFCLGYNFLLVIMQDCVLGNGFNWIVFGVINWFFVFVLEIFVLYCGILMIFDCIFSVIGNQFCYVCLLIFQSIVNEYKIFFFFRILVFFLQVVYKISIDFDFIFWLLRKFSVEFWVQIMIVVFVYCRV